MPRVIILGTSNAIPSPEHENTHLAVVGQRHTVLIDCVSNPVVRLEQAGIDFDDVTDIILTHFHPDHVSGLPLLLMDMWLMGRRRPLDIYGLPHTLDRVEELMKMYGWEDWPDFFPVEFCRVPADENAPVLDCPDFRIVSSPVKHFLPTIGLRFEFKQNGKVLTYSCDTEPCPQVVRLAEGADVLIHEAAGPAPGHTSAEQAGEIAAQAEVGMLYLIHYPTGKFARGDLAAEAQRRFQGPVKIAHDFMVLDFE
jgi:ribonuclease Z